MKRAVLIMADMDDEQTCEGCVFSGTGLCPDNGNGLLCTPSEAVNGGRFIFVQQDVKRLEKVFDV